MGNPKIKKAVKLINKYLKKFDSNASSLEKVRDGYWKAILSRNYPTIRGPFHLVVDVLYNETDDITELWLRAAVKKLPKENLVAIFRQLLVWNDGPSGFGRFSIHEDTNTIYLILRRPLFDLDYEEFSCFLKEFFDTAVNSLHLLVRQFNLD
jgi:hypothetical protein